MNVKELKALVLEHNLPLKFERGKNKYGRFLCLHLGCERVTSTKGTDKLTGERKYKRFCEFHEGQFKRIIADIRIKEQKDAKRREEKIKYGGFNALSRRKHITYAK